MLHSFLLKKKKKNASFIVAVACVSSCPPVGVFVLFWGGDILYVFLFVCFLSVGVVRFKKLALAPV